MKLFRALRGEFNLARRNHKKRGKLDAADVILLRYPKSGVTWLRMMVSQVYFQRAGRSLPYLIGSSEFERQMPECPRVFVAMDNIGMSREDMIAAFGARKVVLLLRDPRDIAVSLYFQFSKRSTALELRSFGASKKGVRAMTLYDFVMNPELGLPRILDFENFWQAAVRARPGSLVLRYEELRRDPEPGLTAMLRAMGEDPDPEELRRAIDFASFENMKKLEAKQSFGAGVLKPGNAADADSFKVRKGKPGGYRDYFTPEQLAAIDALVETAAKAA